MYKLLLLFLTSFLCICCGGKSDSQPSTSADQLNEAQSDSAQAEKQSADADRKIEVTRKDLDAVLARGPAYVLAMVQTDAHIENGRFIGFKIVSFRTPVAHLVGLNQGDIVRGVNGHSIERPEQYFKVFELLKTAQTIEFEIMRESKPATVICPIVE